jgi:hypothetical protein
VRILTLSAYLSRAPTPFSCIASFCIRSVTSVQADWFVRILTLSAYPSKGSKPFLLCTSTAPQNSDASSPGSSLSKVQRVGDNINFIRCKSSDASPIWRKGGMGEAQPVPPKATPTQPPFYSSCLTFESDENPQWWVYDRQSR